MRLHPHPYGARPFCSRFGRRTTPPVPARLGNLCLCCFSDCITTLLLPSAEWCCSPPRLLLPLFPPLPIPSLASRVDAAQRGSNTGFRNAARSFNSFWRQHDTTAGAAAAAEAEGWSDRGWMEWPARSWSVVLFPSCLLASWPSMRAARGRLLACLGIGDWCDRWDGCGERETGEEEGQTDRQADRDNSCVRACV